MKVKLLHPDAIAPTRGSDGAAGYDLYCYGKPELTPKKDLRIATGIAVEIPDGYVGVIKERSSWAMLGMYVMGGVIDSDYRGEIIVLIGGGAWENACKHGERIAQLIVAPCLQEPIEIVSELSPTDRGDGGFGSTGA